MLNILTGYQEAAVFVRASDCTYMHTHIAILMIFQKIYIL